MKILLINNFHYRKGGSEAVYFNTAEILRKNGHEVVFFSYIDEKNMECEQAQYFVEHKGTLGTIRDYFYNKDAQRNLEALLEQESPDIAHVHLFWGGLSASIFKALKKYNVPLVHTAHDYRMVCPGYTFKNGEGEQCEQCMMWNFYQCALHRCAKGNLPQSVIMALEMYTRQVWYNPIKNIDGFVFVSHFSEEKHIEHNPRFASAKRMVLYNYTTPMFEPAIKDKEDYFLFYGRLSFEKGIPTLLKVFAKHPEWKIKVVGTGPLENQLKAEYGQSAPAGALARTACYEHIQFLGYHSGGTLFELVRNAKFVCVPSEWYENNPMTIIESYSLGTPVIGSHIGGIPEIVHDSKTGFLFEPGNEKSLEKAIDKATALTDEEYAIMCDAAYRFYKANFNEAVYYDRLIGFYNEIIKNK